MKQLHEILSPTNSIGVLDPSHFITHKTNVNITGTKINIKYPIKIRKDKE